MSTDASLAVPPVTTAPRRREARDERATVRGERLRSAAAYLLAALGACAGAVWALRLWQADLRVPLTYWGDALAVGAHVKTTLETGWYEFQPLLGAPAGQTYHDFPTSDNLHVAVMRVLGLVLGDWGLTMNVYYLLGFPLAAVTALVFLRGVGLGRLPAVPVAVLFALAPYHLFRGVSHLWLASYYPLPLALLVVWRVALGRPLWTWHRGGWRRWVTSPALFTGFALVLVACGSAYYALFVLALLGVAAVASLVQRRDVRRFVGAVAAGAVTGVALLLNMLPDVLWARSEGSNAAAFGRVAAEAEIYALKLTSLLFPVPDHPVPALAALRRVYDGTYPLPSEQPALGATAALGLVALLVVAVMRLLAPARTTLWQAPRPAALAVLAGLALAAFLFATVGGVSSLISFITPAVRGWNRMTIVIALLALAAVAVGIEALRAVLARRAGNRWATVVTAGLAVGLTVVGAWDQRPLSYIPDHAGARAQYAADAQWVAEVEDLLEDGAMVAQLPYQQYPESPALNGVFDADRLRPYLHSDTLRWTQGGVKGRASAEWMGLLDPADAPATATALAAADASAVLIDRAALGEPAEEVSDAWRRTVGDPAVTSADGRYEVFDLRDLRARLVAEHGEATVEAAGDRVVHPTMVFPATADMHVTTVTEAPADGGEPRTRTLWTAGGPLDLVLDNARDTAARVAVRIAVPESATPVVVRWEGSERDVAPGESVEIDTTVPSGRSPLTVTAADGGTTVVEAPTVEVLDRPVLPPVMAPDDAG